MKQLYFIRHGESELNRLHTFAGQLDTPLTTTGVEQAKQAIQHAQDLGIDLIVSSPLVRALRTAQIIAEGINYPAESIVVNGMFKERSLGSLEGKPWDNFEEDASGYDDVETEDELLSRAKAGLEYLQSLDADIILLAGHGSFSRALRRAIDPSHEYGELENAQIVRLI